MFTGDWVKGAVAQYWLSCRARWREKESGGGFGRKAGTVWKSKWCEKVVRCLRDWEVVVTPNVSAGYTFDFTVHLKKMSNNLIQFLSFMLPKTNIDCGTLWWFILLEHANMFSSGSLFLLHFVWPLWIQMLLALSCFYSLCHYYNNKLTVFIAWLSVFPRLHILHLGVVVLLHIFLDAKYATNLKMSKLTIIFIFKAKWIIFLLFWQTCYQKVASWHIQQTQSDIHSESAAANGVDESTETGPYSKCAVKPEQWAKRGFRAP